MHTGAFSRSVFILKIKIKWAFALLLYARFWSWVLGHLCYHLDLLPQSNSVLFLNTFVGPQSHWWLAMLCVECYVCVVGGEFHSGSTVTNPCILCCRRLVSSCCWPTLTPSLRSWRDTRSHSRYTSMNMFLLCAITKTLTNLYTFRGCSE